MYRLTERRWEKAKPILEKYREQLQKRRLMHTGGFEHELRDCWNIGYRELKDIAIDMLKNPRYRLVAAYYMQHQNAPGPVSEFKRPLAALYGVDWYHSPDREEKQKAFWDKALNREKPNTVK